MGPHMGAHMGPGPFGVRAGPFGVGRALWGWGGPFWGWGGPFWGWGGPWNFEMGPRLPKPTTTLGITNIGTTKE